MGIWLQPGIFIFEGRGGGTFGVYRRDKDFWAVSRNECARSCLEGHFYPNQS